MRVVVVGGGGAMAAPALRILGAHPGVGELVVADRRADAAAEAAARIEREVVVSQVDVLDRSAMDALLEHASLVVNCAGPFFRLAVPVLTAAVATRTHYVDICDDWEPIDALFDLDGAARAAGVTALVGMGASPGLSNLLVKAAADELDEVHDVVTAWPVDVDLDGAEVAPGADGDGDGDGDGAALVHWMQQISGEISVVRDGRVTTAAPLSPIAVEYPGRGRGTGYLVGHPEPLMLRRSLAPAGDSSNVMVVTAGTAAFLDGLRRDVDDGSLTLEQAAAETLHPSPSRVAHAGLRSLRRRGPGKLPGFFAHVTGRRDGRSATVAARLLTVPEGMAGVTGVPLGLAAAAIVDGTVDRRGVVGPEDVFDPSHLFGLLAPHCVPAADRWQDVVAIDRSW